MKKVCAFLLLIVFLVSTIVSVSYSKTSEERVIVVFKEGIDYNLVKSSKGRIKKEYKKLNSVAVDIPSSEIAKLKKNPKIIRIETDAVMETSGEVFDWAIKKVKPFPKLSSHLTGRGVTVAVVDTGITPSEKLNLVGGISTVKYTSSYSDDNGHGTQIAGIIGSASNDGSTTGMAVNADLLAVKAFDEYGDGYLSDIIEGIEWAITQKVDIINLSIGTSCHSELMEDVLNKAYSEGILIVAAAGNGGTVEDNSLIEYPAKYSSVIAVGSVDSNNNRSSFSPVGSEIEVTAPGECVLSIGLNDDLVACWGTSMAAAFVSGNLALLKEAYPNESVAQIRSRLQQNVIDIGVLGKDDEFGYGLILAPFNMVMEDAEDFAVEL